LGHIIFTSVRQDLSNEENLYILLRILWLKANIFLCQGDVDIVMETLELVKNFINIYNIYKKNNKIFTNNKRIIKILQNIIFF